MKFVTNIALILLAGIAVVNTANAQVTTTSTTLATAVDATQNNSVICLTSATGVNLPSVAPTGVMIGKEFMYVLASTPSSTCFLMARGYAGTAVIKHIALEVAWVGPTGGFGGSPFRNADPDGGAGSYCLSTTLSYLPQITVGAPQNPGGKVWSCPASGSNANTWVGVQNPVSPASGGTEYFIGLESGANNAITGALPGVPQSAGVVVAIKLSHTLQAGANTFALNGATAANIKSHYNVSNNIGTAYAATGTVRLMFDGTQWVDLAQ